MGHQPREVKADRRGPDRSDWLCDGDTGAYVASSHCPANSIAYLEDGSGIVIAASAGRTWTADIRTDPWAERADTGR